MLRVSSLVITALLLAAHRGQAAEPNPAARVKAASLAGVKRAVVPGGPPAAIFPLANVRPGMTGYALTVFSGTKPDRFKIKVVSVMRGFLPKQDIILIRAEDPRVEFSGIAAGMSGSPVYIDDKLVGAVAYAWSFAKEPLGGVTPIEAMLAERNRPRRIRPENQTLAGGDGQNNDAGEVAFAAAMMPGPSGLPTGGPAAAGAGNGEPRLVRASVPLSVSGFTPQAFADLEAAMRPVGVVPVQAGGGRRLDRKGAGHLEPGSAIGVELVRGDMNMVATGTVTYIDGSRVLAFGHPLFGLGEVYLPMVDAEIHAFLPALSQSFKLSSPLHEVGTLIQDRQSCIIGDLDARTGMIPIDIRVTGPGAEPRLFHAEVARNRRLTPTLAAQVLGNAISDAEPDATDMVVSVLSKVSIKGHPALELRDNLFSSEGVSGRALAGSRGMRAVSELLLNPFEPLALDRLEIDVRIEYQRDVADIVGLALPGADVRAGDTVPLRVTLRPYAGAEYVETIPVVIPAHLGGGVLKIEVASGAQVKPEMPPVESLRVLLDNLRRYYTASSIVVSLQTPDDGVALRGRMVPGLPASALDTLQTGNQTRRADAYRVTDRTLFQSKRLVSGKQELSVYVREDVLGKNTR
jgi:hypothetical protein